MQNEITHYVALDLGSESTAAYFESAANPKGAMIFLQQYAQKLISTKPTYYLDNKGNISPRLKTAFSIKDGVQSAPLPEQHSELEFLDANGQKKDYDKSLFTFFGAADGTRTGFILPNPKIPFQSGAEQIIPKVEPSNQPGTKFNHPPLVIVQHLITQIVRNLILCSKEIKEIKDIDPKRIHLTLTMPNVYSLTHMESIRTFVEKHAGVGRVEAIYESDAVAYFARGASKATDPDGIRTFKRKVLKRKNKKDLRIVTIDIGRGTTDLSLIRIIGTDLSSGTPDTRKHFVYGRTGKSDGGNQLSYVLAEHYNQQLRSTFNKFGQGLVRPLPFDFLTGQTPMGSYQTEVLKQLQDLIEVVKKSFNEDYTIGLSSKEQISLISHVIDSLFDSMDSDWKTKDDYQRLRQKLGEAMILPRRFPGVLRNWWINLRSKNDSEKRQKQKQLSVLKDRIARYVEENIKDLINELEKMVVSREKEESEIWKKVFDKDCTFVLIAGRASQFKPLKQAIYGSFGNFPPRNIQFLEGDDAKEACCKGAVTFQKSLDKPMNADELHGTYGFLAAAPDIEEEAFRAIDTSVLNIDGVTTIKFNTISSYYLVYSTRHRHDDTDPPELQDGATAFLDSFRGAEFKVDYDKRAMVIKVNDTTVVPVPTFGDVDDDIFPKIWPELVRPE